MNNQRIGPKGDGEHPGHDHEGCGVTEPRGDPEQAPVPEALPQVPDQATLGRDTESELDDVVRQQHRDEPGEQKREPDAPPAMTAA